MKRLFYILTVVLATALLWACQVDLVQNPTGQPDSSLVNLKVDWSNAVDDKHPDMLNVVAWRIVNDWWCAYRFDTETGEGEYTLNPPSKSWPGESDTPAANAQMKLRRGDYRFFVFTPGLMARTGKDARSATVQHEVLTQSEIFEKMQVGQFDNYNSVSGYVMSDNMGYVDSIEVMTIDNDVHELKLTPKPVCQRVNLNLTISKEIQTVRFTVDSIVASMSGVAAGMVLNTGQLITDETYCTLFRCSLVDGSGNEMVDSWDNTDISIAGRLDVLGLIPPHRNKVLSGDGILQLLVYVTVMKDDGMSESRHKVQAVLNMYNVMNDAGIVRRDGEGRYFRQGNECALNVKSVLKINGYALSKSNSSMEDVARWVDSGSLDIEM